MSSKHRLAIIALLISQLISGLVYAQRFLFHLQIDPFSLVAPHELKEFRIRLEAVVNLIYVRFILIGVYVLVSCAQLSRRKTGICYATLVIIGLCIDMSVALAVGVIKDVFTKRTEPKWYAKSIELTFMGILSMQVIANIPILFTLMKTTLKPAREIPTDNATNETIPEQQVRSEQNHSFDNEPYNPSYNSLSAQVEELRLSSISSAPTIVNTEEEVALEILVGPPPPYRP